MSINTRIAIGAVATLAVLGAGVKVAKHALAGPKTPTVSTIAVADGEQQTAIMAEGSIIPSNLANVTVLPSYTGQVTQVLVDVGQHVTKGQVMAILDPSDQEDLVQQADAEVSKARAQLALAVTPHRPEEIREAQLTVDQKRVNLESAQAKLTLLQKGNRPEQVAAAQAAVAKAQAELDSNQSNYDRDKALFDKDLLPRLTLQQDKNNLTAAQAGVAEANAQLAIQQQGARPEEITVAQLAVSDAQAQLDSAKAALTLLLKGSRPEEIATYAADVRSNMAMADRNQRFLDRRFIRAPISGVVVQRNVNPGEVAQPGAARTQMNKSLAQTATGLFTIGADDSVNFAASVDQMYFNKLHLGQPVNIQVEAYPGRAFTGKITRISPMINPQITGQTLQNNVVNPTTPLTFTVWVTMANPKGELVTGQTGFMSVSTGAKGLVVPQNAVTSYSPNSGVVYVVKNGVVHSRHIRFDQNTNGDLHVLSGLKAGESVIVAHATPVADGMSVNVQPADPSDFSDKAY